LRSRCRDHPPNRGARLCVDRERAAEARSAAPIRRLDDPLLNGLKLAGSMMEAAGGLHCPFDRSLEAFNADG
jgi:hypothetical protein